MSFQCSVYCRWEGLKGINRKIKDKFRKMNKLSDMIGKGLHLESWWRDGIMLKDGAERVGSLLNRHAVTHPVAYPAVPRYPKNL